MTAEPAPPQPPPPLLQSVNDAAFEAFASCDFADAALLAAQELRADQHQEETKGTQAQGVLLPCPGREGTRTTVHIIIRLEEICSRYDKLAAILLQCAYELKRESDEVLFVQHYARQGSIPFPVALIW